MKSFWCLFGQMYKNQSKKPLRFSVNSDNISRPRRSLLFRRENCIPENVKSSCENLINTVVYGNFWGPFPKKYSKPIKKNYVFHYSLMRFRNFARPHFSVGKTWFCGVKKKETGIPYKHCRLWSVLRSFSRKGQKGSREPLRNWRFADGSSRKRKPV